MSTISKIRGILLILIATSVALLVTIVLYSQEQIRQQSSIIETERIVLVNQLASRIDLMITNAEKILENAAIDENIKNSPDMSLIDKNLHGIPGSVDKEKRIVVRNILSTYQDFESIGYILPNGDIYFVEPYDLQKTLSVSNVSFRDYYKAITATHDTYVSSIIVSAATNHPVAAIAVPIFSENSSMAGILASGMDLHTIQTRLKELHSYRNERILIVDNNKALVADSAETGYESGQILPEIGVIQDAFAGRNGTTVESINGQKMFLAYHPIRAGQNTWAVVSIQPYDDAFLSVNATIQESYILGILILIITSLSSYYMYRGFQFQRRITKELEKANVLLTHQAEQLRQTDIAKDEFSAMVTHELKTPLVTIGGYAEMLKDRITLGTLNTDQLDAVKEIYENSKKLERLIGDIFDAQKTELKKMKFNMKNFMVDEFMNEMINIHTLLMAEKKIDFVNSTKEKMSIKSDDDRIAQVFGNLIKNSVDFVPENGRIEINAKNNYKDVVFYVKDNGIGIPKEKQIHLFKKFYQIDTSLQRRHGGTGLGLVICKGIVDGLGGKIWLESDEGKGTTFYFSIPK